MSTTTTTNTDDAFKRRTTESLDLPPSGGADEFRRFVYAGVSRWEIIEELDGVTDTAALLVSRVPHGQRIDDEVSHRIHDPLGDEDYYSHRDNMNTLYATTDGTAAVVERYDYGDYGDVRFFDGSGTPLAIPSGAAYADTLVEARSLYTGRRPIPHGSSATSMVLVDYRHRVMEPYGGRFAQRDPMGYVDSPNPYAYVTSNPINYIDPMGLLLRIVPGGDTQEFRDAVKEIKNALKELCPGISIDNNGHVKITGDGGGESTGCACLEDLVDSPHDNTIRPVLRSPDSKGIPLGPTASPGNREDSTWRPIPGVGPMPLLIVPGRGTPGMVFWDPYPMYDWIVPGNWYMPSIVPPIMIPFLVPNSVTLGHELCGHVDLFNKGIHPPLGHPDSEVPACAIEDNIRDDLGLPPRQNPFTEPISLP